MLGLNRVQVTLGDKPILQEINVTILPGDFVIVVGHNGSGKSTLLDVISGVLIPQSGSVMFYDHNITHMPRHARMHFMSLLYQNVNHGVVNSMTVAENIALAHLKNKSVGLRSGSANAQNAVDAFQRLYLYIDIHKAVGQLSGGQRQVLAFFMATLTQPKLLLCDEPTAALDPLASACMMERINQFAQKGNCITIMVTHELDDAITYGNKLWVIKQGSLVATLGSEKQLLSRQALQDMLK